MNLSSIYSEIKEFFSCSDSNFDLEKIINQYYDIEPDENKLEILGDILSFINNFSMFREIKPFMNSLSSCINKTLEIKSDSIYDFEELLIKNSIMHFIQEYINYSKITQEEQVLKFLTDSLEKLQVKPLIMNLGLLLKPMYQDQFYLKNLKKIKEIEVTYDLTNNTDVKIKNEIDSWLTSQDINLENQEEIKKHLKQKFENLIIQYNISKHSEKFKKLETEVMEMLTMKLTLVSLMEHMLDDSFEPIPIK